MFFCQEIKTYPNHHTSFFYIHLHVPSISILEKIFKQNILKCFVKHMSKWDRSSDDQIPCSQFLPRKKMFVKTGFPVRRADFPSHSGQGRVLKLKIFKQGGRVHHKKNSPRPTINWFLVMQDETPNSAHEMEKPVEV